MSTAIRLIKFTCAAAFTIVVMLALAIYPLLTLPDTRAKTVVTKTVVPADNIVRTGDVHLALVRAAANHDWFGMGGAVLKNSGVYSCRPSQPSECVEIQIKAVGGTFQVTATGYSRGTAGPALAQIGIAMASMDIQKATP